MFSLLRRSEKMIDLLSSKLFNEETFYETFLKDLNSCGRELIIESPFVSAKRLAILLPIFEKLKSRKVRVVVSTRDPQEHDDEWQRLAALRAIASLQSKGIHVLYVAGHHRKLAIIDRSILYEGSSNILSQNNSREVMRRIASASLAWRMIRFIGIDKLIG